MITLFSIPKAFKGHTEIIQRNAIQNWLALGPEVEVFVCGDDSGVEQAARDCGARFIGDIDRNEFGTPILRSAFDRVARCASNDVLGYVNADIMFLPDFLDGIRNVHFSRFLLVGQRWDLDVRDSFDFRSTQWGQELQFRVRTQGELHESSGIDYFVFRKDEELCRLPPFAVGRPGWDNWFIYHARRLGIPVIDATGAITPIHQNHDYRHVSETAGGKDRVRGWYGPEAEKNWVLVGHTDDIFTTADATHVLTDRGVKRALDYAHLCNRWNKLRILAPRLGSTIAFVDRLVPKSAKRLFRRVLASS
jgi:hypothetical protein